VQQVELAYDRPQSGLGSHGGGVQQVELAYDRPQLGLGSHFGGGGGGAGQQFPP